MLTAAVAPLFSIAGTVNAQGKGARPDTVWFRPDDRFTEPKMKVIEGYDTILFTKNLMNLKGEGKSVGYLSYYTTTPGYFTFNNPGRYLCKPSSMNCDFSSSSSQWCFERSKESEHFVVFWEKGVNFDADYILAKAERAWDVYVGRLGFLTPGSSSTDKYKIVMRMFNSSTWIASGSGEDLKVGTLNLSPSAYQARGGHTVAHEVGHTFQYLTNVDNGANYSHGYGWGFDSNYGDNCFWEDCANWQAYKVYPEMQFSDGEYFEQYMSKCHLNMIHEDARYTNCYYQDYLCERFGLNFIGRLWRESNNGEDPIDTMRRLLNLSQDEFSQVMFDCFAHMCTWDIEGVRSYAKHRVGAHPYCLETKTVDGVEWFQVKTDRCPQNYGYNITQLKMPAPGETVKVNFQGLVGESGYKTVNASYAGWRWGIVTLMSDGSTQYGDMQTATYSDRNGQLEYVVPEGAKKMWLVVMGAPKTWWHHPWDRNKEAPATNGEQWPYRVSFDGTRPSSSTKTYTANDFPADYQRKDTTVVIDAHLAYSSSGYTSTMVQYDMDAISEALGITTAQLKAIKVGASFNPRFVGVNANGTTLVNATTTSTSSSTCLGHWFNTNGNICNYDSSAGIYAEMFPADFTCKVGQYPGRLVKGRTYTVRQGVAYKHTDGKTYKAIMQVNLTID